MIFGYLLRGISLGLYAGVLPGPTQAFILSRTVKNGWKHTLPLALVPLISDLPIALIFCFLVSTFPDVAIQFIQIAGGVYLGWLGFHSWKTISKDRESSEPEQSAGFWQTVGINLGNPNVYIFWGTIGAPIVLSGWSTSPVFGLSFIFGMYSMLIITVAATIFIFGLTGHFPSNVKNLLLRGLAVGVIVFGLFQIITGLTRIIDG